MTKSSSELQKEREAIRSELLLMRQIDLGRVRNPREVTQRARALRTRYDLLETSIQVAETVEVVEQREDRLQREHARSYPGPSIAEKKRAEQWRLSEGEVDPDVATAEWRGPKLVVRRGCLLCGQRNVKVGDGVVGYQSLGASGRTCKACTSAISRRENGPHLGAIPLATMDRLRAERPDIVRGVGSNEYRDDWLTFTWAGRLSKVDPGILGQQEPPSAPFGFLAAPQQLPAVRPEGTEEE